MMYLRNDGEETGFQVDTADILVSPVLPPGLEQNYLFGQNQWMHLPDFVGLFDIYCATIKPREVHELPQGGNKGIFSIAVDERPINLGLSVDDSGTVVRSILPVHWRGLRGISHRRDGLSSAIEFTDSQGIQYARHYKYKTLGEHIIKTFPEPLGIFEIDYTNIVYNSFINGKAIALSK